MTPLLVLTGDRQSRAIRVPSVDAAIESIERALNDTRREYATALVIADLDPDAAASLLADMQAEHALWLNAVRTELAAWLASEA